MSSTFWNALSRISDIGGVLSIIAWTVGWIFKFRKNVSWPSMLLRYAPWFTFFIGMSLARWFWPLPLGPIEINLTRSLSYTGPAEIRVQNIQFVPPHIFDLKGTYRNIPVDQSLLAYVLSTEGLYHLKEIRVNPDGTWTTTSSDPVAMGSADKVGGSYEAGLILAQQPTCIDVRFNKDILRQLPSCVSYVQVVEIIRHH